MLLQKKHAEEIFITAYDDIKDNDKCYEAFSTLWLIIEQYGENKTKQDRIISFIDPDARVGNKTKGNLKRGYKDFTVELKKIIQRINIGIQGQPSIM